MCQRNFRDCSAGHARIRGRSLGGSPAAKRWPASGLRGAGPSISRNTERPLRGYVCDFIDLLNERDQTRQLAQAAPAATEPGL